MINQFQLNEDVLERNNAMFIGMQQTFRGFTDAIVDMIENDANTFQIFIRNPRNLKQRQFYTEEYNSFNSTFIAHGAFPYVVHAPYAINPAAMYTEDHDTALSIIHSDLNVISRLSGKTYYVLHPGHYMSGDRDSAIKALINFVHETEDDFEKCGVTLCLEFMAGQGTEILTSLPEAYEIINKCTSIKFCIDTCHTYAAGIRYPYLIRFFENFPEKIGVIHLNNSKTVFESKVDRHLGLRNGFINYGVLIDTVRRLLMLNLDTPVILETPYSGIKDDFVWAKNSLLSSTTPVCYF